MFYKRTSWVVHILCMGSLNAGTNFFTDCVKLVFICQGPACMDALSIAVVQWLSYKHMYDVRPLVNSVLVLHKATALCFTSLEFSHHMENKRLAFIGR